MGKPIPNTLPSEQSAALKMLLREPLGVVPLTIATGRPFADLFREGLVERTAERLSGYILTVNGRVWLAREHQRELKAAHATK